MAPSPSDRLTLVVEQPTADAVVARLVGDLDAFTASVALGALADLVATAPAAIVLDLSEVAFLDSYGLRVLLDARAGTQRRGGELSLRDVSPVARRVLGLVSGGRDLLAVAAPAGT